MRRRPVRHLVQSLEARRLLAVSLIKDVNNTPGGGLPPDNLTTVGSIAYFVHDDGIHGQEPWRTDGTAAGTFMLKDVNPGRVSSFADGFITVGSNVYFSAVSDATGGELWKTDGTPGGTVQVKDIVPGPTGSTGLGDGMAAAVGSTLFFFANDSVTGVELWKSDGTAAGTTLVADTRPGSAGLAAGPIVSMGGYVYYRGHNGTATSLYRASPTTSPELLKSAVSGSGSGPVSNIYVLKATAGRVYFGDTIGYLWMSNGTAAGTVLVDGANSSVTEPTVIGSSFYYIRGSSLRRINDGASAPTIFDGSISSTNFRSPSGLLNVNGALYLFASAASVSQSVYRVANSTASPLLFSNLGGVPNSSGPARLAYAGGMLYYSSYGSDAATRLFRIDLAAGSSVTGLGIIRPANLSGWSEYPLGYTAAGTSLVFINYDTTSGIELWRSNGTAATTGLLLDISPATNNGYPYFFGAAGNKVIFRATSALGDELWATDGTAAGTQLVADITPGTSGSAPFLVAGNGTSVFFSAYTATTGYELYISDGTTAGTRLVKDINPGSAGSDVSNGVMVNGIAYFNATTPTNGVELWRSDGTDAGTYLVKDVAAGSTDGSTDLLFAFGGKVYFGSSDSAGGGNELWYTDGTAAGTAQLSDINAGSASSNPGSLLAAGNWLYFAATGTSGGRELYRTDGTTANTTRVADIRPGSASASPMLFAAAGNTVYFTANDGTNGVELWKSDGTAAGTSMVVNLAAGAASTNINKMVSFKGKLFFGATLSTGVQGLYITDGTSVGTQMIKDFGSSGLGVYSQSLIATGGRLLLLADDGIHGTEPWISDGTAAGTVLAQDIGPGWIPSQGLNFIPLPSGTGEVFAASDIVYGIEPYLITDDATPQVFGGVFNADLHEIVLPVTETLAGAIPAGAFTLRNSGTNAIIPNASLQITFNNTDSAIHIRSLSGVLPDGNYRLTIAANQLADRAGNLLAGTTLDFFVLAGDLNRDRNVNFDDLLILAQNYGQTGRTFSQGNLDYSADGLVGFDDLLLLAQRYGSSILATASRSGSAPRRRLAVGDLLA
jgi:ELWxxDGT repeat protein